MSVWIGHILPCLGVKLSSISCLPGRTVLSGGSIAFTSKMIAGVRQLKPPQICPPCLQRGERKSEGESERERRMPKGHQVLHFHLLFLIT